MNKTDDAQTQRKLTALTMLTTVVIMALVAVITPDVAYSDKNPQAECIKGQNQGFIGKEQSGEAYQFSKDTCQTLSK
jgi:hypothetical protein